MSDFSQTEKLWNQYIDPSLRGAASGALLDIPEWVAKQIDREGTEKYIAEHEPQFRGGQMAGTITGGFIPVGGLAAKAVQGGAKLLQGAKAGTGLAKVGAGLTKGAKLLDTTGKDLSLGQKLLRGTLKGAGTGALESGVRAAAGDRDILGEALTGGAFGGVFGGLGGALKNSKGVLEEAKDISNKATTGSVGLTARNLKQAYRKLLPSASGGRVMEDLSDEMGPLLAKKAQDWNLLPEVGRDDRLKAIYRDLSGKYKVIDKLAEDNVETLTKMTPDVGVLKAQILDDFGPSLTGDGREMLEKQLDKLIRETSFDRPLVEVRKALDNAIQKGFGQNAQASQIAQAELAKTLRLGLDDAVDMIVDQTGAPGLKDLAQDWKAYRVLSEAVKMDEFADWGKKYGGSPTFEKAALGGLMGLGSASTSDWTDGEKLQENIFKTLGASAGGAFLPKITQGLASGALARSGPILDKLSEIADPETLRKIGEGVSALGPSFSGKAGTLGATGGRLGELKEERENPEPVRQGPSPFDSQLQTTVAQQLYQAGIPPEQIPQLLPRIQAGLAPEAKIKLALPKEQQKDALEKLKAHKALESIAGAKSPDAMTKARAEGELYDAVSKVSATPELKKYGMGELKKILKAGIGENKKRKMISDLLADLDPSGYGSYRDSGVFGGN